MFRYTGKILLVASLLKSAFSVSIFGQHSGKHLLRHQADIKQALHQASHQGGSYNSKTSLSVYSRKCAHGAVFREATYVL